MGTLISAVVFLSVFAFIIVICYLVGGAQPLGEDDQKT